MKNLKQNILQQPYPQMHLPDERSLAAYYQVSRSLIACKISKIKL